MSEENTNTIDTSDDTINKGWSTLENTIVDNPVIDPIEPDEQAEEQTDQPDIACADLFTKTLKMGLGNKWVNVDIAKIEPEIQECAKAWDAFFVKRFGGFHVFLERYGVEVMMVFNTGYLLFKAVEHREEPLDQTEGKSGRASKANTQPIDPL